MAFQNPAWIVADAEFALNWGVIPLVPTLNILCLKFPAVPLPHKHEELSQAFCGSLTIEEFG